MARKPYDPPFSLRLSFEERARLTEQAEGQPLGAYIRIVGNIVASFVDQSFGLHPVQLSLAARANRHFQNGRDDAILGLFQNDESIDPGDGGASNAPNGP